ncbi:MAG: type III secretion system effector protein [Halobacteriovoraceae bacterium]|nr:type III secretion system effector protein [Halobacteriovoraceae bacterium]
MAKRVTAILLLFVSLPIAYGEQTRKLSPEEEFMLIELANEIIKEGFPSLNNEINGRKRKFTLKYYSIKDPQYFMESNFTIGRVLLGIPKYRIGVNPIIFDKGITRKALKGVLAHELVHSEDYYNGSTLGTILPIGIKIMKPKSRAKYERGTDRKVIKKGFGANLLAYRLWQYEQLDEDQIKRKKREYLTPQEIEQYMLEITEKTEE